MRKFVLSLALGTLTVASAQTADMAKPFSFQDGTAKFEGCVLGKYGNYVSCYWNYTRTAAGEANMRLETGTEVALYSVTGSKKNIFGYAIGETPSGGTVIQGLPTTLKVKFFVPDDKEMIGLLKFYNQTYRNIPILKERPSDIADLKPSDFTSKLGTCFEQTGKWLCIAELTPKP